MLGAIAGDIIGSVHEHTATKTVDFELFADGCRFTDDTVLALAVAECVIHAGDYVDTFHRFYADYPDAGYGAHFVVWASSRSRIAYNSWGNGAAMRVPAIGHAFNALDEVLTAAAASAAVTHNHPEGIRGAQATAAAIFLARQGENKSAIATFLEQRFGYALRRSLADERAVHTFDTSCAVTVPAAVIAFLASDDFESAVRNAVSLGGDADTLACIAGAIAEAFYGGVPEPIAVRSLALLDDRLRAIVATFADAYGVRLPAAG